MRARAILLCVGAIACSGAGGQRASAAFDGRRAFEHVRELVAVGPRPSGSAAAERARGYILSQLATSGVKAELQPFEAVTPVGRIPMNNIRVTLPGSSTGAAAIRLLIAGHYDTKRFDGVQFVGANDGGSSAAFLLELARVLKGHLLRLPIEVVFFDGEEAIIEWNRNSDSTYGSRYYVEAARRDGTLQRIGALVLVDMIGDRDLRIPRDSNSTPWLTDIIWSTARREQRREFVEDAMAIEDDHLPFLAAGVPSVDIIDLDYAAWHTSEDTLDKVSPQSLQAVGDVLLAALPAIVERLAAGR